METYKVITIVLNFFKMGGIQRVAQILITVIFMLLATMSEVLTISAVVPLVSALMGGEIPGFITDIFSAFFVTDSKTKFVAEAAFKPLVVAFIIIIMFF